MWHTLSLRARLIILVAFALVLGMSGNIARLIFEAAPRVHAEDQSVVRLALEFVQTLVADLDRARDPEATLTQLVRDMGQLRHVSITRQATPGAAAATPPALAAEIEQAPGVPSWFVAFVHPEQTTVSVPVVVNGKSLGTLAVTSHPSDEMAEIWDGIVIQIEIGLAITLAVVLLTVLVVNRALAPIETLKSAMTDLEAGHYGTRIAPSGSPELATICVKLNELASVLGETVEGKRRLAERVVSLQDVERREIARDLHDEFGPHLFALRAQALALRDTINGAAPDLNAMKTQSGAMLDKVNNIQQINRRVLERLRPVGLAEFGLQGALDALLRFWRETHPGMEIETSISASLAGLGETVELTIYRIIQEALTNIFRHARASRVEIIVAPAVDGGAAGSSQVVVVSVRDDGEGLPADYKQGFGLTGMQERVQALGGSLDVVSTGQGSAVTATLPYGTAEAE
ncbi:MAG: ATP-binding protein [Xanthobacteraceae bacterium]|jgi:two-component system sensor histidine kinase UhpB